MIVFNVSLKSKGGINEHSHFLICKYELGELCEKSKPV